MEQEFAKTMFDYFGKRSSMYQGPSNHERVESDDFWGKGVSNHTIDPLATQKIKAKYMKKLDRGEFVGIKGVDIHLFRISVCNDDDKDKCYKYRVYYGKKVYDEYNNNCHLCNINPNDHPDLNRNCDFCHLPSDHNSCGYGRMREENWFLKLFGRKCNYS